MIRSRLQLYPSVCQNYGLNYWKIEVTRLFVDSFTSMRCIFLNVVLVEVGHFSYLTNTGYDWVKAWVVARLDSYM